MKSKEKAVNKIKKESKKLAFSPISENLVRMGFVVRGLIYGTIGLLAIKIASGISGSIKNPQGAIELIGQQLYGRILLGIILIGLVGFTLGGLIKAIFDPLHKGNDLKGILQRVVFFISAIPSAILILPTYNFIFGFSNTAQNSSMNLRNILSTIFLIPFGKYIVGLIGLIVLGVSLFLVYQGLRYNFDENLKPYGLTKKQIKVVKILGRFGTLGRAVVFFLIGIFLLFASYQSNSSDVKGIDGALMILLNEPYGSWLLGIVAAGLISFGCYSILSGYWFKFKNQKAN